MQGIKETTELIEFVGTIKDLVVSQLKDGFQKSDLEKIISELLNDKDIKMKLEMAIEGIDKIMLEMKDLSLTEKISLISALIKHMI